MRAVMSTPAPGPIGTMNLTARSGQARAGDPAAASASAASTTAAADRMRFTVLHMLILPDASWCRPLLVVLREAAARDN